MDIENFKSLLNLDSVFCENTIISSEILQRIDCILKNSLNNISDESLGVYKKFVVMKQEAPEGMKNELFKVIKNYQKEKIEQKDFLDALLMNRFLIVKSKLDAQSYYYIADILLNIKEIELSKIFLDYYMKSETNLPLKLLTVANFYNLNLKDYKSAIKYYEQYLNIEETKPVIFTTLGNLYKKAYGDESLKEQIYYFERAYQLKPNDRLTLHSLAFDYEKIGDKKNANKYYSELLNNNPTDIDYYNYGGFLISCGDLYNGHKYLTHRFLIDDINLKYPQNLDIMKKWNFQDDISDKTILVHYEQGFGDTFMYCRFVPFIKNLCKKIIFVVQDEVFDLIKNSHLINNDIDIISSKSNIQNIEYDYSIALMDLPYILKTTTQNIPFSQGYLEIDNKKINEYKEKHIKASNNLRVGIAYQGNKKANYKGRDIEFSKFSKMLDLPEIDFYSFNMENENDTRITNLSQTFTNFTHTACAIKNMDIIVSTDNVILNLSGALGVKTIGLFNKYPNFRWYKLSGENIGYYSSVTPLQVEQEDLWATVISHTINILKEYNKTYVKKI